MSANVFANGREISAKKAGNRINAAMPDPCLSPPSPPAGPIPVPYPNFSDDSRTDNGTKKVLISGEPVGRKSESSYKDCKGDEAATRNLGMGTISHTIQGKMKFVSWSFDVKFEGSNVPRHLDFMTGNHGSTTDGSTAPVIGKQMPGKDEDPECKKLDEENQKAREEDVKPAIALMGSFTLTSALVKPAVGNPQMMFAAAPGDAVRSGTSRKYQGANKQNHMACKEDQKYDATCKGHTEPKLMDAVYKGGGSIKMKIFHQSISITGPTKTRSGARSFRPRVDSMPCYSCRKAICAAQDCGLDVILCNNNNQEVKAEDLCKNGQPHPPPTKKTVTRKGTKTEVNDYTKQKDKWAGVGL